MSEDAEFRGATKQSIQDIKDDVTEVKADVKECKSLIADTALSMNQQIQAFVKVMNDREERYENKYARMEQTQNLDDDMKILSQRVSNLETWRWTILGGAIVITFLATFFGDNIRRAIMGN